MPTLRTLRLLATGALLLSIALPAAAATAPEDCSSPLGRALIENYVDQIMFMTLAELYGETAVATCVGDDTIALCLAPDTPKEQVDAWHDLIFDYLRGRPNLHLVVMLIDSRHGIKDRDREVIGTLKKAAVPFLLVLTKCDLVRERELAQGRAAMETELRKTVGALPAVLATSSRKLAGIDALRAVLAGYALAERPQA